MLDEIFNSIVRTKRNGNEPTGIVITDEVRRSILNESIKNEMQLFTDGEERLYGLVVTTDPSLKVPYEILT